MDSSCSLPTTTAASVVGLREDRFRIPVLKEMPSYDDLCGKIFHLADDTYSPSRIWRACAYRDHVTRADDVLDVWVRRLVHLKTLDDLTADAHAVGYRHAFHDESLRVAIQRPDIQSMIGFTSLGDATTRDRRLVTPLFFGSHGTRRQGCMPYARVYGMDVAILFVRAPSVRRR